MIAGGVMTGLGVVTGNKKLQKWGGILSIAGGIGGLATGAWASTATEIGNGAFLGEGAASGVPAWDAAASSAAGGLGDVTGTLAQLNAGVSDIGIGAAGAGGMTAPPMTPGIAGSAVPGPSIPQPVNPMSAGGAAQPATKAAESGGMLSNMGEKLRGAVDWAQKGNNPRLVQAGAGLLQAGLGAYGQAEAVEDQMRMQEEAQARARKRLSDSVQGVTVPVYQRKGG